MKLSPGEQDSIVALLTRIYMDLSQIESDFGLLVGAGDFRPRIEYFHDAVRALSSGDPAHREEGGRLCIELLDYDLRCLRYLQDKPLSSFKPHAEPLSPKTDLVAIGLAPVVKTRRPDRALRERITELYQHYAVLFAALLKPQADRDYHERADSMNQDVEELHALMDALKGLASGKSSAKDIAALAEHLENEELRKLVEQFLRQKKHNSREDTGKLNRFLKEQAQGKDKGIAAIEKAHLNYVMSQLAIFENSKDMLKSMAKEGMNLVGKFVQASIAEAQREVGR